MFFSQLVFAQVSANDIVNQVLFSEGGQSWTSRDLNLYSKTITTYLKQEKLAEYSESATEDFLISRLLKREAVSFDLHPQNMFQYVSVKNGTSEFSRKETEDELLGLSYAITLYNLKTKQMTQKVRFKAWIDVLKRKYQVKMKTNESISQR